MYDRLPVPYGLVRFGVAPDHPEVKAVTKNFDKLAESEQVRFVGNVEVGRDVTVPELQSHYDAVVFCSGCPRETRLGIPGSNLRGVFSAHEFVSWYNGHPDYTWKGDLRHAKSALVVGNGNVALDVARILQAPLALLAATDITQSALEALRISSVRTVHVVGRRGPVQAAFTNKEMRELIKLEGCETYMRESDLTLDATSAAVMKAARPKARMHKLMRSAHVVDDLTFKDLVRQTSEGDSQSRRVFFHFRRSPVEYAPRSTPDEAGMVGNCLAQVNHLEESESGSVRAVGTDKVETIPCDVVFESIGYRGSPIPDVPFDTTGGTIPNEEGRVTGAVGLYTSGWIKRGPSGIVGSNRWDAHETVLAVRSDVEESVWRCDEGKQGYHGVAELLQERAVQAIDWQGWQRLDHHEIACGEATGKPREKVTDVREIMDLIRR